MAIPKEWLYLFTKTYANEKVYSFLFYSFDFMLQLASTFGTTIKDINIQYPSC